MACPNDKTAASVCVCVHVFGSGLVCCCYLLLLLLPLLLLLCISAKTGIEFFLI
jgi:hypothetical protein